MLVSYNVVSFERSPIRGEIAPVRPRLNDKSLRPIAQEFRLENIGKSCSIYIYAKMQEITHKESNSVRPAMSPLIFPVSPIDDKPLQNP